MASLKSIDVSAPILGLHKLKPRVFLLTIVIVCSVLLKPSSSTAVDNQRMFTINHEFVDHEVSRDPTPLWKEDDAEFFNQQPLQDEEVRTGAQSTGILHQEERNTIQLASAASGDLNWEAPVKTYSDVELDPDGSSSKNSATKEGSSIRPQSRPSCSYKEIDLTQSPGYRYAITKTGSIANVNASGNATRYISPGIPVFDVTITNTCQCCGFANIRVACGSFSSAVLVNPNTFKRVGINDCLVNNGGELKPQAMVYFQYATTKEYNLAVVHAEVCHCLRRRC